MSRWDPRSGWCSARWPAGSRAATARPGLEPEARHRRRGRRMVIPWSVDAAGGEPGDPLRVVVVEEQRLARVEAGDASHLVVGELEVEDVDVLGHPVGTDRLGDDDDVALGEPAQDDLGDRLPVRGADLAQRRIGEEVVLALGERAPGLEL